MRDHQVARETPRGPNLCKRCGEKTTEKIQLAALPNAELVRSAGREFIS
jgi:hypothetical protein